MLSAANFSGCTQCGFCLNLKSSLPLASSQNLRSDRVPRFVESVTGHFSISGEILPKLSESQLCIYTLHTSLMNGKSSPEETPACDGRLSCELHLTKPQNSERFFLDKLRCYRVRHLLQERNALEESVDSGDRLSGLRMRTRCWKPTVGPLSQEDACNWISGHKSCISL